MPSTMQHLFVLLILLLGPKSVVKAVDDQDESSPASAMGSAAEEFQDLLQYLSEERRFTGSLSVNRNGTQLIHTQMGIAFPNNYDQLPNYATQYRIGSITKMFTAVLILQLIEEDKLTLDDTRLADFLPNVANAESITIHQMLRHQSGLRDFANADEAYRSYNTMPQTRTQMLERIEKYPSEFSPGTKSQYSNTNFLLLGYIIEDLTMSTLSSYEDVLRERIVQPLNLSRTGIMKPPNAEQNVAFSFKSSRRGGVWESESDSTPSSISGGAGAIMSTAIDLTNFVIHLFSTANETMTTPPLLTASSLEQMLELDNEEATFGLGIFGSLLDDERVFGHSGAIDMFTSLLWYTPESGVAISIVANGRETVSLGEIAAALYRITLGKDYKFPQYREYDEGTLNWGSLILFIVLPCLIGCVILSMCTMRWYRRKYPKFSEDENMPEEKEEEEEECVELDTMQVPGVNGVAPWDHQPSAELVTK